MQNRNRLVKILAFSVIQIVSILIFLSAYGIIRHYIKKINEIEGKSLSYEISFMGELPTVQQTRKLFENIEFIDIKLDHGSVYGMYDDNGMDIPIVSSFAITNGKYSVPIEYYKKFCESRLIKGRYFENKEYADSTKNVCVTENIGDVNSTIDIMGDKYNVIGVFETEMVKTVYIPYIDLPDNIEVIVCGINLKKPLLKTEYDELVECVRNAFGTTAEIPAFDGVENATDKRVNTYLIILIGFAVVVCATNNYIMYQFILEKRRRRFAIERICGCSKKKAFLQFFLVLTAITILLFSVAAMLFSKVFVDKMKNVYEYIGDDFSTKEYCQIGIAYILVLCLSYGLLISGYVKRKIVTLLKEM